jgi:hypothetical protein
MLTDNKEINAAIRNLTTELLVAMKPSNPRDVEVGATIERALARLVDEILKPSNQSPPDQVG